MIKEIKTYQTDRRMPLSKLYESFDRFDDELWIREKIHIQKFKTKNKGKNHSLPILGFRTKIKGPAIWLISGIHGEEPAGPNALSHYIGFLNDLARRVPLVVLPICNPVGYVLNWRYPDQRRYKKDSVARSVGSSEHYLPDLKNNHKPREKMPLCEEAEDITSYVLKQMRRYKPILVLDFHEDESSSSLYIYSQGKLGSNDPIAKEVVSILEAKGFKIRKKGKTMFNQIIKNGIIGKVHDGSIDELLAAKYIVMNKKLKIKPQAKSVIVIETSTKNIPIETRIKAHSEVLLSAEKFYDMARLI